MKSEIPRKAWFLDRDGTVIVDRGYLADPAGVELLPGAAQALCRLAEAGYLLVMVTNQSGIGRGIFGESDYASVQRRVEAALAAEGVAVAGSYHCPHGPDDGCHCRKPRAGLLERAARELGIALDRSVMVGDKESDVEAGRRAGCRTVRIAAGPVETAADLVCPSLAEAVEEMLKGGR